MYYICLQCKPIRLIKTRRPRVKHSNYNKQCKICGNRNIFPTSEEYYKQALKIAFLLEFVKGRSGVDSKIRTIYKKVFNSSTKHTLDNLKQLEIIIDRLDFIDPREIKKEETIFSKSEPQIKKMVPIDDQEKESEDQHPGYSCFGNFNVNSQVCLSCPNKVMKPCIVEKKRR